MKTQRIFTKRINWMQSQLFMVAAVILVMSMAASAQIMPFQKKFGTIEDDNLWRVDQLPNGNFISVGNTNGAGAGDRDVQIVQFDINGQIINSWVLGDAGSQNRHDVAALPNGDIVLIMMTANTPGSSVDNLIVMQIDLSGNIVWTKQFGDDKTEVFGEELIITSDNQLLITGIIRHEASFTDEKAILIKMNTNGSVLFRKEWNASTDYDFFKGVVEVSDGYIVSGYSDFLDPASSNVKVVLAKFTTNGQLIWSNIYDDGSLLGANNIPILANPDGSVIVSFYAGTATSNAGSGRDIIVMKVNIDGSPAWANRIGGPDNDDVDEMKFSHEGNLLIVGDLAGPGFGGREGLLMIVDQNNGDLIKANAFGKDGSDQIADIIPIVENNCNGYIMVGQSSSFNLDGSDDAWIIKTPGSLDGFMDCYTESLTLTEQSTTFTTSSVGAVSDWNVSSTFNLTLASTNFSTQEVSCQPFSGVCITSVEDFSIVDFAIYPNPNNGKFIIQQDMNHQIEVYEIIDLAGKVIYSIDVGENQTQVEIELPPQIKGMFILKGIDSKGTIRSQRLVIQ